MEASYSVTVFFLVWIILLLWVKLQGPHVCIIHLAEQEAVVAYGMGSYFVLYLLLCLLHAGRSGNGVCCRELVSKLCCVPPSTCGWQGRHLKQCVAIWNMDSRIVAMANSHFWSLFIVRLILSEE